MISLKKCLKYYFWEIIIVVFSFLFSSWLMFSTFSYKDGFLSIALKAWSDFGSTIPLIRSFSFGANFPPQHPLFPGEPIRYHFLFYLMVGLLEKAGIRIDYSLNILSIIGFSGLIIMIYLLAKKLFNSRPAGILSVILFLFNGSLSFVEFFKLHPLSLNSLNDILLNQAFPSFGPYDGKIVSAFWNLNIYTNQRHLAFSFALVLLIIYLNYQKNTSKRKLSLTLLNTLILITLFFLNQPAFLIAEFFLLFLIIFEIRKNIILAIPVTTGAVILFFYFIFFPAQGFALKFGFLTPPPVNFISFFNYWLNNYGLYLILIPLSFFIVNKKQRLFFFPLLTIFAAANIFQFSTDIINNHKFFNFVLIMGGIFISNLLIFIWEKRGIVGKMLVAVVFLLLTLSGIIDLMPIKNDGRAIINDLPTNPDALFILKNTNPKDIILNSRNFYHPASLAGRPVFFGYSYFAWSYGYNTEKRGKVYLEMYEAPEKKTACNLFKKYKISYVDLYDVPEEFVKPNRELFEKEFKKIYYNPQSGFALFDVRKSCYFYL